jgi:2,5-diketo-D-gluconate reductase A
MPTVELADDVHMPVVVAGYSALSGTDLADPALTGIARAHGVGVAQVVLRWHLHHGIVGGIGAGGPE